MCWCRVARTLAAPRSAQVGATAGRRAPTHRARIVSLLRHKTASCRDSVRHKPVEQVWMLGLPATRRVSAAGRQTERQGPAAPKINSLRAATPEEVTEWCKRSSSHARAKQRRRTSLGPCMPQALYYGYGAARAKINSSVTTSLPDVPSNAPFFIVCTQW